MSGLDFDQQSILRQWAGPVSRAGVNAMNTDSLARNVIAILFVALVGAAFLLLTLTPPVLVDKSGVTLSSPVPQFTGHNARAGLDGNEDTLFHSELGVVEGVLQLNLSQPIAVTRIQFFAQRDGAGTPLLQRLPAFVRTLNPEARYSRNGAALLPANLDPVNGTATFELPPTEAPSSRCLLYAISPADCLTFAECTVSGHSSIIPGLASRLFVPACCCFVLGILAWWIATRFTKDRTLAFLSRTWLHRSLLWVPARRRTLYRMPADSRFVLTTILCAMACCAVIYLYKGLHITGLWVSPFYHGDGLWFMAQMKSMMEEPRWWLLPSFGAPLQADMRDFPTPDYLHIVIIQLLTWLCGAAEPAFWLYYVGSFGLTYALAAFTFRRLGVCAWLLHILACGFAYLPYHFIRMGHYCLSMYYTLPLAVLATTALRPTPGLAPAGTCDGPAARPSAGRLGPAGVFVCDAISAFSGAYYCFWYLLLLAYGAAFALVAPLPLRTRLGITGRYLLHVGITVLLFKVGLQPFEAVRHQQGPNPEGVSHRLPLESDLYATSLVLLITPSVVSRLAALVGKTSFPPFATALPTGESVGAYVGVPATLGIFLACLVIMRGIQRRPFRQAAEDDSADDVLRFLAPLVLYLFLWTTFGGFNALFAQLVTPQIRCWNRLSVLLSFVAAGVFGLEMSKWVDGLTGRWPREGRSLLVTVIGLTLATCIAVTQLPSWTVTEVASRHRELDDAAKVYFGGIAARPAHAGRPQVLMLPYMAHPEVASPDQIEHYAYFLPFMHSDGVRWSFGGCRGRPAGEVYKMLATRPPAEMLPVARRLGYTGILVCRPDVYGTVVREVAETLGGQRPALSADGHWAYFDLPGSIDPEGLSPQAALEIAAGAAP